jgi:hypothetical protein
MYAIEDGIPIPPARGGNRNWHGPDPVYDFHRLAVGNSVLVDDKTRPQVIAAMRTARRRMALAGLPAADFTTRKVREKLSDGTVRTGIRVWRTA